MIAKDGKSRLYPPPGRNDTSLYHERGTEAPTNPRQENVAEAKMAKPSRECKTKLSKAEKKPRKSATPIVEARPVQSMPAHAERPLPPLRPEAYPRPHPIEPEYPRPAPPPSLFELQSRDKEQQSHGKRRMWITISIVLLALVLGVTLGVVFGVGDKQTPLVALFSSSSPETEAALEDETSSQYQAMEWLTKDVEENGFDLSFDEDQILARGALAVFFYSTNGDGWDDSTGWLKHNVSECDWFGIACTSAMVTKLDFYNDNLGGTLPRELSFLSRLEYLSLRVNSIGGTLPTALGLLTDMKSLYLYENQLAGTLPTELGLLHRLEMLSVFSNSLKGNVPSELGALSSLEYFYLQNNEFTGQVPSQVCELQQFSLVALEADCGVAQREIECECCTECCPGGSSWCD